MQGKHIAILESGLGEHLAELIVHAPLPAEKPDDDPLMTLLRERLS